MQSKLSSRSLAIASALLFAAPSSRAEEGATWDDLDAILATPPGHCSLVVYVDENGNRLAAPPPGVAPLRVERVSFDQAALSSRPDGARVGGFRPKNPGTARASAVVVGSASTFSVSYQDSAGEGYFDATPVAPVGGNAATTRGAQRRAAMEDALLELANELNSASTIEVEASFDPLTCGPGGAVLGAAGPNSFTIDTPGAIPNTIYPGALADALAGGDQDPGFADIVSFFNSGIDANCLPGFSWYYGLDGNAVGSAIDFRGVVLHEALHGLGFLTLVDLDTGERPIELNDHFMIHLRDNSSGLLWPAMSNAQRAASAVDNGDLVWNGSQVSVRNGFLVAGNTAGRTRLFAPNPVQPGSSVSHWDAALNPDDVMEPFETGTMNRTLTRALMGDIGYTGLVPVEVSAFDLE